MPPVIQDEGTALTQRAALNFAGTGVVATDDAAGNRTVVTITGGGAAADIPLMVDGAIIAWAASIGTGTGVYRYWRIYITTTVHGSDAAFSEIELRNAPGGPDLTGTGTAFANSAYPGYEPPKAVDDNSASAWNTAGAAPWIWGYDFTAGSQRNIVEIKITPWDAAVTKAPKDFQWQYSIDGITWTTKATLAAAWPNASPQVFNVSGV